MNSDAIQSEARRRLDSLQNELSARQSIVHFARSGVALVTAMLTAGGTGKLFWDLPEGKYYLGFPGLVVTFALVVYSLAHYFKGKRKLAGESERFEALKALRHDLRLDDPAALLPK